MTPNSEHSRKHFTRKHLALLLGILGSVLIIILVGVGILRGPARQQPGASPSPSAVTLSPMPTNPVSPLIFGTNMSLFASASTDQRLDSPATQKALQQIHVQIIRMPVRPGIPEELEIKAAKAIKQIGAVPLVILNGPLVSDPLSVDRRIVQDMKQIFGNETVYYEFGNEEDLQGVSTQRYVTSWNTIIPQLKHLSPGAHFIGPVNYKYSRGNLTAFLQQAQPRPDEVSWHEYVCGSRSQPAPCIRYDAENDWHGATHHDYRMELRPRSQRAPQWTGHQQRRKTRQRCVYEHLDNKGHSNASRQSCVCFHAIRCHKHTITYGWIGQ